jgi:hypothetical protein
MEKHSKNSNGRGGKRPGAGRPKGSLDKGNKMIRELIVQALDNLGGVTYLEETARSHPAAFLSLLGKVMPIQVTGEDGGPVQFQKIERVIVRPAA